MTLWMVKLKEVPMSKDSSEAIRKLNDAFRKSGKGGMIVMTQGVSCEPQHVIDEIREAVRNHTDFSPDNDPYGEHDFGKFEVESLKLFWKIDYYNKTMDGGSEDPADAQVTGRVLTIMLREEY